MHVSSFTMMRASVFTTMKPFFVNSLLLLLLVQVCSLQRTPTTTGSKLYKAGGLSDRAKFAPLQRQYTLRWQPLRLSERVYETRSQVLTRPSWTSYVALPQLRRETLVSVQHLLQEAWWMFPMFLCFYPIYCALMGFEPTTPEFWKMVNLEYLRHSSDAQVIISTFLLSNLSYFFSGVYLLFKFPPIKLRSVSASFITLLPSKSTWLAIWTLLSGAISTIFHAVQALGSTGLAEALCYLDHGIACSAILYFWHVCGRPSRNVCILGAAGVVALALPVRPGYAFLHSLWHLLSAAAAVVWALQGRHRAAPVYITARRRYKNK